MGRIKIFDTAIPSKNEYFSGFKVYPTEESLIRLHRDATRYRWLRLNAKEIVIGEKGYMSTYDNPESLDKTIDERL